jgi:hypothetical protein
MRSSLRCGICGKGAIPGWFDMPLTTPEKGQRIQTADLLRQCFKSVRSITHAEDVELWSPGSRRSPIHPTLWIRKLQSRSVWLLSTAWEGSPVCLRTVRPWIRFGCTVLRTSAWCPCQQFGPSFTVCWRIRAGSRVEGSSHLLR